MSLSDGGFQSQNRGQQEESFANKRAGAKITGQGSGSRRQCLMSYRPEATVGSQVSIVKVSTRGKTGDLLDTPTRSVCSTVQRKQLHLVGISTVNGFTYIG